MKRKAYIFIGRSGSGKGTQAKLLIEHLKSSGYGETLYIETGKCFREYVERDRYSSGLSKNIMAGGQRQPGFLAIYLWGMSLVENFTDQTSVVVFDGTPRLSMEAAILNSAFSFYGLDFMVLHIDISRNEAEERLQKRGREDDEKKSIEERMNWFERDVIPAIEFYRQNHRNALLDIDGDRSVEDVASDIKKRLGV